MCGAIDLKKTKQTLLAAFLNFRIKKKVQPGNHFRRQEFYYKMSTSGCISEVLFLIGNILTVSKSHL